MQVMSTAKESTYESLFVWKQQFFKPFFWLTWGNGLEKEMVVVGEDGWALDLLTLFLARGCWSKAGETHNALYRFNNVLWLVLGVGRRGPKPDSDWLGENSLNDGGVKFDQSFDPSAISSHLLKMGFST